MSDRAGLHSLQASGSHSQLVFNLQRVTGGLYVEREELSAQGLRVVQSMRFADCAAFDRWSREDPVRFDDPWLYQQLVRTGAELCELHCDGE